MKIHAAMRENQPEIIEEAYEISEILELLFFHGEYS